ncbi:ABC transporter ATP-binding protein [Metamycoplasma equirhinis]|uniref:ABC transporter ATP-binding protein n=1 Tax=Metamycoplasma equirhinis TaxID=92402 RepID=UPI003593036B
MKNIIEVKNLIKHYKNKLAVDNISFDVKSGEIFAFLGLNGAGKSTTINMLCQVLARDSGQIKIFEKDIDKHSIEIKRNIGIVFQDSVLDKNLDVKFNLKFKASIYGMNRNQTVERLEFLDSVLDLKDILKRKYNKLSGGQKRRADIAYGLMNKPKLLFLDEPTSGLDPINREKVWNALKTLIKKEDLTIFLTTHYMEEAELANHIAILDSGKIIIEGTVNELISKYSKTVLKIYVPFSEENTKILEKYFESQVEYNNSHYAIKLNDVSKITNMPEKIKNIAKDFEVIKGNMNDVFLNVSKGKNHNEKFI